MPALDLGEMITLVTAIVTVTAVILGQRITTVKLQAGQGELLRQVQAVHRRMDDYGKRITRAERDHAVLVERVENLRGQRDTQRFKLRPEDAPVFKEEE